MWTTICMTCFVLLPFLVHNRPCKVKSYYLKCSDHYCSSFFNLARCWSVIWLDMISLTVIPVSNYFFRHLLQFWNSILVSYRGHCQDNSPMKGLFIEILYNFLCQFAISWDINRVVTLKSTQTLVDFMSIFD